MSKYICIEGNIGAGKTTLAKILAERLNTRLVLEEFEENAFLPKFYEQPERYAFPLEMSFLADRYHQLSGILSSSEDLFQRDIIADYTLYKSMLFAKNNLKGHELKLYLDFFNVIVEKLRKPDLIIFLHRPIDSIIRNIKTRGRQYEMAIEVQYLEQMREKYNALLRQKIDSKVLIINADDYDFIHNKNDVDEICKQVSI